MIHDEKSGKIYEQMNIIACEHSFPNMSGVK